jgi:ATP-binding protein involved in chromosome partitioning
MEVSRDAVWEALGHVIDPELRRPVTDLDMVRDVAIEGGRVQVRLALTVVGCPLRSSFEQQVDEAVGSVPGVEEVRLEFDVMSPDERAALTTKLRGGRPAEDRTIQLSMSLLHHFPSMALAKAFPNEGLLQHNMREFVRS